MKIALFGATGHLGQGILDEALSRGCEVVAIVRDPARLATHHDRLTVVTGDVARPAGWLDAAHGSDASPTDRLVVTGDTSGASTVKVTNEIGRASCRERV